jgi:hypothetical protein
MCQRRSGYRVATVVAFLCLAGGCCRSNEVSLDHEAVGKWKATNGLALAFYNDGVVALHGSKAQWRPIDDTSVRIEDENEIAEFNISKKADGSTVGVFELGGTEMTKVFGVDATYTKVVKK